MNRYTNNREDEIGPKGPKALTWAQQRKKKYNKISTISHHDTDHNECNEQMQIVKYIIIETKNLNKIFHQLYRKNLSNKSN